MATSDSRIPANRIVLLFAVLSAIWVGWLFVPKPAKPLMHLLPVAAESKLRAVGLPDNPDWEGLPELFAVWTNQAPWQDGKVEFAYWNGGAHAYTDFFEAKQEAGKVRFRVLTRTEALQRKEFAPDGGGVFFPTSTDLPAARIAAVDLGTDSPTHPFVFFEAMKTPQFPVGVMQPQRISDPGPRPPPPKLPPFPVPPVTIPPPSLPDAPVKK